MVTSYKANSEGSVSFSDLELDQLQELIDAGDRGGFHYLYYEITGTKDALLTGKISTFSETVGGVAYAANWLLKSCYEPGGLHEGQSETYPGIYYLSQKIAEKVLDNTRDDIIDNDGSGVLSEDEHYNSAVEVWTDDHDLSDQFPGNYIVASLNWFYGYENPEGANLLDVILFGGGTPGISSVLSELGDSSITTETILDEIRRNTKLSADDVDAIISSLRNSNNVRISSYVDSGLSAALETQDASLINAARRDAGA